MTTYTASALVTQVRTATDHDTDTQITDAQILALMDPIVRALQRQCADLAPDLFTATTADATVTAPATTIDLAAAPLSLTDVGKVRTVERKDSGTYRPLPLAPVLLGSAPGYLGWRLRGESLVELSPASQAPAVYRVKYKTKAPALTSGSVTFALPDGADLIVVERTAARVRTRFEEDPSPHLSAANLAWADVRAGLISTYPTTPIPVIDVTRRW